MAHAAGDALDFPIYGAHYRLTFPIFDADGDLVTGAASLDSERSLDAGNFSDCTNEATEINSKGMYTLDLTGAETSAKCVAVIVQTSTTGAKTTPLVIYPKRLPVLETGTAQGAGTGNNQIQLAAGASAKDDFYNGVFVLLTNNDPSGVQYQARRIIDYTGSTTTATVESDWGTNPSSATTYNLLVPEHAMVLGWAGKPLAAYDTAGYPVVTIKDGTGQGELNLVSGVVDANAVQVSGDSSAADALEDMLDGGQTSTLYLKRLSITNSSGIAVEITGSTVGMSVVGNSGNAIAASSGGGNGSGLALAGNGSGDGLRATGGATGDGLAVSGGATSGHGISASGTGTGYNGIYAGAATGEGVYALATSGNYSGIRADGSGSGAGPKVTAGATGNGLDITGGGTSGDAIALAKTSGNFIEAAAEQEVADAVLTRELDAVTEGVDTRTAINALRLLRNKWDISSGTLTVYKEDDTTSAWTGTVTTNAAANPITQVNPA